MIQTLTQKLSRFCHRNEQPQGPSERNKPAEQKVKEQTIKVKREKLTECGMTESSAAYVQYLITERMKVYLHRDHLFDSIRNSEPCSICFKRYASIRCDPCTHGRVCKYCAYEMLKSSGYPAYQTVICTQCYKLIDAFTRWRKARDEEEEETKENVDDIIISSDDENEDGVEHSVSLRDYGWQILSEGRKQYRDNEAFEHSESTGSL